MLVLSRKKFESIVIGDDITITVVEIVCDNKVRLGIAAPKEISIHRREIFEEIKRKNEEKRQ